jgi:DNA-binding winged helix-turn-helix (wHTH) protein
MSKAKPVRYRFDNFEVDIACKSLYENGVPIPLQEKPFLFLATLLQGEGAVVTRAELSMRLWPDTYVQVSQGLNAAARKVRMALKDDAANPRFIETLGSRGYRFICPMESTPAEDAGRPNRSDDEERTA